MTCMKQEFCIHEKYCQRHIGQNFDSCILFLRNSKPQTNEEWLRTATTEQLAEVLNKIFMTRTFCHICTEGGVCDIGYECKYHGGNTKDFVEWLKQPHTTRSER